MDKNVDTLIFDLSNNNFTYYGILMVLFVMLVMLANYIRKEINNYKEYHSQMKNIADNYERKRNARNDLRVIILIINHSIIIIGKLN